MNEFKVRIILGAIAVVSFMFSEILFIYWMGGMNTLMPSLVLFLTFLICTITIVKKFKVTEEF